jgi:hypothetical protein
MAKAMTYLGSKVRFAAGELAFSLREREIPVTGDAEFPGL